MKYKKYFLGIVILSYLVLSSSLVSAVWTCYIDHVRITVYYTTPCTIPGSGDLTISGKDCVYSQNYTVPGNIHLINGGNVTLNKGSYLKFSTANSLFIISGPRSRLIINSGSGLYG